MKVDYSYFHAGITKVPTASSTLVSSSKYLNHAGLRDWLVTHFLRRNGADQPIPADPTLGLAQALYEIRNPEQVQVLIDEEKRKNAPFAAWLEERYLSPLVESDFAGFPQDSLGGAYQRYMVAHGIKLNFGRKLTTPSSDLEFIYQRTGQIHDYEHLITGGQFNSLGELLPYFVRLSNPWRHMSPQLAAELSAIYVFGGFRMVMRAALHYPETWLTVVDIMQRGFKIGLESAPIFMARFEDVLHLPIPEARVRLGVKHAEDFDSSAADLIFTERQPAAGA